MNRLISFIAFLIIAMSFSDSNLYAQSNNDNPKAKLNTEKDHSFYELREENWPIINDNGYTDNKKAKQLLKGDIFIQNVKTNEVYNIHDLKNKTILFITYWDPSSAINIGYFKKKINNGEQVDIALVYYENDKNDILGKKSDSWYIDYCFVLHGESKFLKETIAKIPIVIQSRKKDHR